MTELTSQSAAELAELMRTRAVSPVEVVEAHLRRIEELNPQLNAIVTLSPDVLEQARAAEIAATSGDALVTLEAKPNFRALGKKFGETVAVTREN